MLRRGLLAVLFVEILGVSVPAARLPGSVTPTHYDLSFTVDLRRARFDGAETIRIDVAEPTRTIVLHAVELQFRSVAIGTGPSAQRAAVTLDPTDETATLTVATPLAPGPTVIRIEFAGALNDRLRGFYLSQRGDERHAVTQFESTDARRAFPCFDEPALKATFALTLTIDRNDMAISNGTVVSDVPGPGRDRHTVTFSTTPKMSAYLVAMAVGRFECTETRAADVPIRVCATLGKKPLTAIALETARELLPFYNEYFSIKYPFGKLDLVAIPDFAAGAMENTAAIFFREAEVLADESGASVATRKNIGSVVAHEIAHQWFGDLVTMRWWDDLWLNEGFATWMGSRALAILKPEWDVAADEAHETETAMAVDLLRTTRPIRPPSLAPQEIENTFDAIAYQKGASVLRMIEAYVGADVFRRGINAYLEAHAFGNATSEDFWTAIASASGKPVDRIMRTFVTRPGVPLIDVSPLMCRNDPPVTVVTLTQQRFGVEDVPRSGGWMVPFCARTGGATGSDVCTWVDTEQQEVQLGAGCRPWVFLNTGGRGYFRTAYAPDVLRALAADVERELSAGERLSLLEDEWALVRLGHHTVADFMTLASGYTGEPSNAVLAKLVQRLDFIDQHVVSERSRTAFRSFVRSLVTPSPPADIAIRPADDEASRTRRGMIIRLLGMLGGDETVASSVRDQLDAALEARVPLDPALAPAILQVAARQGNAALFDRLIAAADRTESSEERSAYLNATTEFTDPALVDRGLGRILSRDVRTDDAAQYFARFFANAAARARAWTFLKAHWNELEPRVTLLAGGQLLIADSLGNFCDAGTRDDIKAFFAAHPLNRAMRVLDQSLERIDSCLRISEPDASAVDDWLSRAMR